MRSVYGFIGSDDFRHDRSNNVYATVGFNYYQVGRQTGQIVALLGANGAGKSTTLKAISGLLRTQQGEVTR